MGTVSTGASGVDANSNEKNKKEDIPPKVTSSKWVWIKEGNEVTAKKAAFKSTVKLILTVENLDDGDKVNVIILDKADNAELDKIEATVSGKTAKSEEIELKEDWAGKQIKIKVEKDSFEAEHEGAELKVMHGVKCLVYFRPHSGYKGEFGFDFLRTGIPNNTKLEYKAYQETILAGYNPATVPPGGVRTDLNNVEAYSKFKNEYPQIDTNKHLEEMVKYRVPYLNLFSKTYSETITANINPKPPFEAKLKLWVRIEHDDVDEIRLESGSESIKFKINDNKYESAFSLSNIDRNTKVEEADEITITCLEDLTKDEEIVAYAYPKGSKEKPEEEQEKEKIVAGKLLVCKNDETVRKEEKFVFVSVVTDVTGSDEKEGEFSEKEQAYLRNTLYQALVRPIIWVRRKKSTGIYENISLDMRNDARFQTGGMYVNSSGYIQKGSDANSMVKYLKSEFMKDANNSQYVNCVPVFVLGVPGGNGHLLGYCDTDSDSSGKIIRWIKNSVSFTPSSGTRPVETMPHEALHGYGLRHTHRDENPITDKNQKYVFPHGQNDPNYLTDSTDNIMSYNIGNMRTTWHWQWKIINNKIK